VGAGAAWPPCVALIGFMGSGKSTIGRLLASRLGYAFVDLDVVIEAESGRSIRELFAEEGEEAFRARESAALASLAGRQSLVLAAGGGAPSTEQNRAFFRDAATFYLEITFEEFLERTARSKKRPLRRRSIEELKALYERRRPIYEALGSRIPTGGRSPQEAVEEILDRLRRANSPPPADQA
jgi:shikimate kinase